MLFKLINKCCRRKTHSRTFSVFNHNQTVEELLNTLEDGSDEISITKEAIIGGKIEE